MGIFVLVMMIIANLFANIWYAVIVPFLPLEFKKFGLDEQIYGYIFGAYAGAGMIGALFVGKFMAKVGRRVMLVTGMFFLGVSMIAFGFIHYSPNNLVLTIVCLWLRSLEGLSASMISTTWYSIVAITYRRNQLRYLGYLESTIGIGMMIGPFVGSVLYEFFGFDVTFYILGSVFVSVSPFLYFTVPKTVDRLDSLSFSMSLDQEQLESLAPLSEVQNSVDNKINFTMSSGLGTIADASSSTSKIDITKIVHQRKPIKYSKMPSIYLIL